ncbi:hypothetical protein DL89DRAFT_290584 [Linderina pennispora]|uniref:Matrin-type domain-containing protein n=1 Tax=Linderina pennispora TaxID=61395 RepID=A0A1Y1WGU1_9FUNG|nr:SF3a splicing factor complex subunit PRP9 [Linderina pennispora]ORX72743.1 hypothetical protein DL89DRAFT_290584 [Linderina pennispora]
MQDLSKHKYKLLREHKINDLLDQIQSRSKLIQRIGADDSGLRKREADGIADNKFNEFYARLADVRDFHRRNPDTAVVPPEIEYMAYRHNPEEVEEQELARRERVQAAMDAEGDSAPVLSEQDLEAVDQQTFVGPQDMEKLDTMFSGEERMGRASHGSQYLEYLDEFSKFEAIDRKNKAHKDYDQYLACLQSYFEGYVGRAMPLFDLPNVQKEAQEQFEADWRDQKVAGWMTSIDQESVLFCTACKKQFEKDTTFRAHMNSRKHQKVVARLENEQGGVDRVAAEKALQQEIAQKQARDRKTAFTEYLIQTYARMFADRLRDTRANVSRRQALTDEERQNEMDAEEPEFVHHDDTKDEQVYNPLNLPLGWDGKPIPYWLYKLHGLGVKFDCEVCGNITYRGRKAYERHFQETRHATNMRRLGIPNTRQFHGVAKIDEALALWERVQKEKKDEVANVDTFEEFEDSEGNVFNKKTYIDLKRQGLI